MRPVLGYTTFYSQRIIGLKKNIPAYLLQYEAHNILMSPRTWQADVIKESEPFFLFPIFRTKEIQEELEMTKQALEKLQDIREKETEMVSVISCNFCSVVK